MKLFKPALLLLMISLSVNFSLARASDSIVHLDGDRFTLEVTEQPLSTILKRLSEQGIHILIDPRINPKISATFKNRSIGSAMTSILKSIDYVLIWQGDGTSGSNEPQLSEIRIFYKGQEERIRQLKNSAHLTTVTKAGGLYHIKDILLIQLSPTMTEADLTPLLDQLNATIVDAHAPLGIVQLRLPHGSDVHTIAETISTYPGIVTAEPDYAYPLEKGWPISSDGSSPLLLSASPPSTGSATVAVMDSGLLAGYENSPFVQDTYDAVSPNTAVNDLLGHGTQMALIAAGVINPLGVEADTEASSPVVAIRILDDNGFTSNYTLIRGIDYAISKEARVMSLSWGTETDSEMLEMATRYATDNGLVMVAAAGNAPTGIPVYPAAYENVIGVGALNPDGKPWEQSNYGDFVAIHSPGLADLPVGYQGDPGTYAGTSIATAYTARRVATILEQTPDADMDTILLNLSATK